MGQDGSSLMLLTWTSTTSNVILGAPGATGATPSCAQHGRGYKGRSAFLLRLGGPVAGPELEQSAGTSEEGCLSREGVPLDRGKW